jgi:hypothetical protein
MSKWRREQHRSVSVTSYLVLDQERSYPQPGFDRSGKRG